MANTIFSKILANEIPCLRIYENEHVLAFLDIHPLSPGHTLLIPKEPAPTLDALSEAAAAALGAALPKLCRAVIAATGCRDYNVLQNNGRAAHQEVMHVHFHIIPKPDATRGLNVGWPAAPVDPAAAEALAKKIAEAL